MTANFDEQEPKTGTRVHGKTSNADEGLAHFGRAIAWLRLSEWDKARAELSAAQDGGIDVAAVFVESYKGAGEFEDDAGVELPPDIADIVDPISEEEDEALVRAIEEGLKSETVSEECIMAILRGEDGA